MCTVSGCLVHLVLGPQRGSELAGRASRAGGGAEDWMAGEAGVRIKSPQEKAALAAELAVRQAPVGVWAPAVCIQAVSGEKGTFVRVQTRV